MVSSTPSTVIRMGLQTPRIRSTQSVMGSSHRSVLSGHQPSASPTPSRYATAPKIFPESNLSGLPMPPTPAPATSTFGGTSSMLFGESSRPRGYDRGSVRTLHNPAAPTIPLLTPNRAYRRPRDSPKDTTEKKSRRMEKENDSRSAGLLNTILEGTVRQESVEEKQARVPRLAGDGYYTEPPMEKLQQMTDDELSVVQDFAVGHVNWGRVLWPGKTDVRGLNLDELVRFGRKQVEVYAPETDKPPVGEGLNKRAHIELRECWPKVPRESRGDPDYNVKNDTILLNRHAQKLMRKCEATDDVQFESYDQTSGVWRFEVEHFTVYGDTSDDEDENVILGQ